MTPPKQSPVPIYLDADLPLWQLKAALGGTGLKVKATRKGMQIVLAAKERK